MHLSSQDVALLEAAVEIEIETQAAPESPAHRTIIWVVTDGPDAFIRSYRGAGARWYREASARPEVVLHVGDQAIRARVVPAVDADSVARTSAGLTRKYTGDSGLTGMLAPAVLDTTLRLEAA
jgi:hypothetical protein